MSALLNALHPRPDEVLLDPGCGHDARLLIAACRYFEVERAIGIEIDPEAAESARRHVAEAGLSEQIEIITGDSTKLAVKADVGVAYLWPETLAALRPQIEKLNRFACYGFAVPGLPMTARSAANGGKVFVWQRPPAVVRVPVTKSVKQIVPLPRGSHCQVCGRRCSNPMAHRLQQQVVGYQVQPVKPAASAGRWVRQKVCINGQCTYRMVWKED